MNSFYKYPTTPYLIATNNSTRSDKILSERQVNNILSDTITVEEKIDGANLGISFSSEGTLLIQNRGHYISQPYIGQWKPLTRWLNIHEDMLFDKLSDRLILFGEWCYAKHSVYYNKLPDWFIAFDVYDKVSQNFYSVTRRNSIIDSLGITIVPCIATGKFTFSSLKDLLTISAFGDDESEGLYIRRDDGNWLNTRAKLVRPEFTQSINLHWSKSLFTTNKLIY